MNLYPYQEAGALWLAGQAHGMLWDQMRLGKTPQAVRACDHVGADRVLVVCPAIARQVWKRGFANWALAMPQHLVIESYDVVARRPEQFVQDWDVVILDEAHYLKTRTAKRTEAIYGKGVKGDGIIERAAHVWPLTGTPCPNHAAELWTHLRALHPSVLASTSTLQYHEFLKRYCVTIEGNYGPIVVKNKNTAELKGMLEGITLRRTMAQVFSELPKVRFFDEALQDPKPVDAFSGEFVDGMELPTSSERREVGERKAPLVVQRLLDDLIDREHKCVVFAYHKSVIDVLKHGLSDHNPVIITGETGQAARDKAIRDFQNRDEVQVFIGQIDACHSAIDLSRAHTVEIVEPSWVPEINVQAAWRCMNIAQRMPVTARMFSLANTLDDAIIRTLARKASLLSELLGE